MVLSLSRPHADTTFWAGYAQTYDLAWDGPIAAAVRAVVAGWAPHTGTVVEIGCGTGLLTRGLATTSRRVVGVDASTAMLRRAARTGRVDDVVLADASATGLPGACADLVLVANVVHLHPRPDAVLDEAIRLARPHAPIVVVWPPDDVSFERLLTVELGAPGGWRRALAADAVRRAVGIVGAATRLRRAAAGHLDELAAERAEVLVRAQVHGCQDLLVLGRRSGSSPSA